MLSAPFAAMASRMRSPMRSSASSHDASRNSPAPLSPVRMSGVSTRSGAYTRWAWRFTLAQIQPSVSGFSGAASMWTMRPSVTVTASEQASGQSSVQAVCTTWVSSAVMPRVYSVARSRLQARWPSRRRRHAVQFVVFTADSSPVGNVASALVHT